MNRKEPEKILAEIKGRYKKEWKDVADILRFVDQLGLSPLRLNASEDEPVIMRIEISS